MKKLTIGVLAGLLLAGGVALAQNVQQLDNVIMRAASPYIRYQGTLSLQNAAGTAMARATQTGFSIGSAGTAFTKMVRYQSAVAPVAVAANTTAAQTLTVTGVAIGELCAQAVKPTEQAGLGIVGCRVSGTAANSIVVTFSNNTGSTITPTTPQTYDFLVVSGT